MEIKQQSTGNNDSVEDAVIAIMNIKTTEGKLINFKAQAQTVYDALKAKELYTHPHQWQGLTDDEFKALMDEWSVEGKPHVGYGGAWAADGEYLTMREFVSAIEQALKEKNHG
jgi:hypothetical protein